MSRSNDIAGLTTSILDGVTATEVGLGNVTNESKATMFTSPTFTGDVTLQTGNLVIGTAGKGIDFSAQTSSTATDASVDSGGELFDHYEEGVWKAQSQGGALVASKHYGRYTRVGNLVTITGQFQQSTGQSSGNLALTGIPFPIKASPANGNSLACCAVRLYNQNLTQENGDTTAILDSGGVINFYEHVDDAGSAHIQRDDSAYIAFTMTYMTS